MVEGGSSRSPTVHDHEGESAGVSRGISRPRAGASLFLWLWTQRGARRRVTRRRGYRTRSEDGVVSSASWLGIGSVAGCWRPTPSAPRVAPWRAQARHSRRVGPREREFGLCDGRPPRGGLGHRWQERWHRQIARLGGTVRGARGAWTLPRGAGSAGAAAGRLGRAERRGRACRASARASAAKARKRGPIYPALGILVLNAAMSPGG